ncbi:hypothetical protein AKG11_26805 [Shinella sp. SUS2]|nr:hypothetical protein AKG11_26805 [Shinella sp. SUS2]KOC72883.1 hypothetical protein AKG10_24585 [Shinella sp. GWS1]
MAKSPTRDFDHFILDRLYPEPHDVFKPTATVDPSCADVIVALDTNALLLPYQLGKSNLDGLATVYAKLANERRLFLPEQVAREFIKNRDRRLADMVQAYEDRISRFSGWDINVSPLLLEGFADREALTKAAADHEKAANAHLSQLRALVKQMKAWRGNDPVSAIYAATFGKEHLIGPGMANEKVIEEMHYGLLHQVPPGYKDASKDDQGIGDVLVWLSLLDLGKTLGKDLVFVTGEQKADWFVRAGKQPLYPRPELVDAYRRASAGRSLRLSSLHDFLRDMEAPETLVDDVEIAEASANNAIQAAAAVNQPFADTMRTSRRSSELRLYGRGPDVPAGAKVFDYSTHDGNVRIEHAGQAFDVAFSKSSDTSIHLIKRGATRRIGRVKNAQLGQIVNMNLIDTTSSHYTIQLNESFLVENDEGAVLAGRISGIQDDTRGSDRDEVRFFYTINPSGSQVVIP